MRYDYTNYMSELHQSAVQGQVNIKSFEPSGGLYQFKSTHDGAQAGTTRYTSRYRSGMKSND